MWRCIEDLENRLASPPLRSTGVMDTQRTMATKIELESTSLRGATHSGVENPAASVSQSSTSQDDMMS